MSDAERLAALRLRRVRLRREQELARQHPAFLLDRVRMIDEKTGDEFRFFLTDESSGWFWQRGTLDEMVEHQKVIILKARQLGITWLCAAYQLWEALTKPGTRHIIFRQREDDSIEIVRRVWLMFESLPEHLRFGVKVLEPRPGFRARTTIALQHPDGRVSNIVGMVATERAGRGSTVATVLFDEAAFIEKFRGIWSSTISTVGVKGKMFVVSTANGMSDPLTGEGNYYHRLWVTAAEKSLHTIFLGWQVHPDRDQEWYETSDETQSIDERERAQEYPSTPSEAFRLTNATYYDKAALEEYARGDVDGDGPRIAKPLREIEFERKDARTAKIVERRGSLIKVYREPVKDSSYAIGVDIAAGRGLDYSAAYVIDLGTMEIAAEMYDNRVQSDQLAFQLHYLGNRYNKAWIAVDRTTGWGEAVVTALRDGREGRPPYPRLYRQLVDSRADMPTHKPYGIALGEQNRPKVVNQLGRALRERALPWLTSRLHAECAMFVEWPTGTSPRAAQGANDDCVMACAIALELYRQKGHWPDRHRGGTKVESAYKPWLALGNAAAA